MTCFLHEVTSLCYRKSPKHADWFCNQVTLVLLDFFIPVQFWNEVKHSSFSWNTLSPLLPVWPSVRNMLCPLQKEEDHTASPPSPGHFSQGHLQLTVHPSLVSSIDSFCSVCKNTSCQTRGNTSFYFLFEMSLPCLHYQSPFPSTLLSTSCNLSISGFLLRTSLKGTPWPANYHSQWQWGDHHQIEGLQVTIHIVLFCIVYIFYIEHIESEKHLTVAFF